MTNDDIERRIKAALDLKANPDSDVPYVINTRSFAVMEARALVVEAEAKAYEKAERAVCICSTGETTGEHLGFCPARSICALKRLAVQERASSR